jgi:RHS repeat-associated protein
MPFGESFVDEHSSTWESPYKFSGKEIDAETGLYYFGARYYDPKTSIWYGIDPLAGKYPNVGGYVYCHNNPVNRIDPTGMLDGEPDKPFGKSYEPPNKSSSANKVSQTVTVKEEKSLPKNPLFTLSVNVSKIFGEAKTTNLNIIKTLDPSGNPISTSTEFQAKTSDAGGAVSTGAGKDGSTTAGASVFIGPLQIGISQTDSPDAIHSSMNLNVDVKTGENTSAGFSIGIKPLGVAAIVIPIAFPDLLPALLPALVK